ncbi:MAG: hypothetical protein ACKO96_09715, partial [Flammeovirgaceae bacterium]
QQWKEIWRKNPPAGTVIIGGDFNQVRSTEGYKDFLVEFCLEESFPKESTWIGKHASSIIDGFLVSTSLNDLGRITSNLTCIKPRCDVQEHAIVKKTFSAPKIVQDPYARTSIFFPKEALLPKFTLS